MMKNIPQGVYCRKEVDTAHHFARFEARMAKDDSARTVWSNVALLLNEIATTLGNKAVIKLEE